MSSNPSASELHLCHVFATFGPGGPQVRTAAILNALPAGRYRHTIIAMDGRTGCRERLDADVRAEIVEPRRNALRMGSILRRLRPDLLVTYNWGSMDAAIGAALYRVRPWIHAEDGFNPDEAEGQKARRVWARRILLRGAAALVLPSLVLRRIATEKWKVPAERTVHIPNGVDLERFSPGPGAAMRAELGIPEGAVVVGTVAGLRRVKNPLRLLEAFAAVGLGNAHLVFVGAGEMEGALKSRIAELGLEGRAHLAGHVEDTVACHRMIDVFALSSDTEQMPLSVVEAMGCARPVLSPDVGDIREMVAEPNRGLIVPDDDEAAYRDALRRLLTESDLRAKLGGANRARAEERYAKSVMVEAYRSLYERTIAES